MKDANDGRVVSNALVELLTGPNAGRGVRTDSTGAYSITGLATGAARAQASATGYISDGANLDFAADTTFTFQLRPSN